jgi:elongation factor P
MHGKLQLNSRNISQSVLELRYSSMLAKDIKTGMVVVYEGSPVVIKNLQVSSPSARGAATLYRFRGRNLLTRNKIDMTLKGTDSMDEADFYRIDVQMLYTDPTHLFLMDKENFQQYELPIEDAEEELPYITEGLDGIKAMIYNDNVVGLELPASVELTITQTDPSVKGNSATSRTKPATMETGLIVHVPEYMKEGERLKIDTRTGEFLSRA